MIPVHPQNQLLLRIQWNGSMCIDRMLPFGLHSAPNFFPQYRHWILSTKGISHMLHYLDDLILVANSLDRGHVQKAILTSTFKVLQYSKLEGSSTCLQFLGIVVDIESLATVVISRR